ncbi:MAG: hypothetical protein AAGI70_10475, partial [Pseudomonadota bacterium]
MPTPLLLPLFLGTGDTYLHTQMAFYYLLAALLGLALGWLIWGWGRAAAIAGAETAGARKATREADAEAEVGEVGRLR